MRAAPPPPRLPSRRSSADWLRDVPPLVKAASVVVPIVLGAASAIAGAALAYDDLATDAETVAAIATHNARPRTSDPAASPHPDLARGLAALELRALQQDKRDAERLARDVALFGMVVRMLASDLEQDRRRKMAAGQHAEAAFKAAVARGLPPHQAADMAIDDAPPWRR